MAGEGTLPDGSGEAAVPDVAASVSGEAAPAGGTVADGSVPVGGGAAGDEAGLSGRDRAVLDIAARTWTGPGPRDRAIRERLGMSPTAYFQLLNALLDDPRALRHAPVTVNRLRARPGPATRTNR